MAVGQPGVVDGGTMVVIQGPRFSTTAESEWFQKMGAKLPTKLASIRDELEAKFKSA